MDIQEILRYLPHRYPFLLIDRVIEITPGKSLVAIKNVTINEPFFQGHFPGHPVMPGVLILEALAQATCVLANKSSEMLDKSGAQGSIENYLYLFAGVDNVRFKRMVEPGDQLHLHVEIQRHKQGIWKFTGEAKVNGELVCSADMTSAKKEIKK